MSIPFSEKEVGEVGNGRPGVAKQVVKPEPSQCPEDEQLTMLSPFFF